MFHKLKIPPTFSIIKKGATTLFVKEGYKEIIPSLVFDNESVYYRCKNDTSVKFGRGSYLSVPLARNSAERLIIRNYRHGGLLGKLLGGVFYDGNRPLSEIYVNEFAFQKGVPSAEVIAITKRKLWGLFYRANFISKEISGAVDITQFIKESPLNYIQKSKKSIIFALVRLIRNMHDAGIYHADLHLKNILLQKDSNGEFQAYIIDLDKSVIFNKLSINQRIKNLLRLNRSLEKLRWLSGETDTFQKDTEGHKDTPLSLPCERGDGEGETKDESLNKKIGSISKKDRIRFLKSYMLYNHALDKDWKRYIRQYRSNHTIHKLCWHVLGFFSKYAKKGKPLKHSERN